MNPAEIAHGPMFIGLVINILLYGIMITQVYIYYTSYPTDQEWMKLFVLLLFMLDTLNVIFDCVYLYQALVRHFGDFSILVEANWVFATDPALTAIIAGLVQGFFAWRIQVLCNNLILSGLVIAFALPGTVAGVVTAVEVHFHSDFRRFRDFKPVVIVWLLSDCICDILITAILVLNLKTGFDKTDFLIDRIIGLTMRTGFLTMACAVIDLILFLVSELGLHLIFNFPLSKLYTNSLMSSLNSRPIKTAIGVGSVSKHTGTGAGLQKQSTSHGTETGTTESGPNVVIEHHQKRASLVKRVSQTFSTRSGIDKDHPAQVHVTVESEDFLDSDTVAGNGADGASSSRRQSWAYAADLVGIQEEAQRIPRKHLRDEAV